MVIYTDYRKGKKIQRYKHLSSDVCQVLTYVINKTLNSVPYSLYFLINVRKIKCNSFTILPKNYH